MESSHIPVECFKPHRVTLPKPRSINPAGLTARPMRIASISPLEVTQLKRLGKVKNTFFYYINVRD